jgi:SAM-dependent methyltransferase
MQAKSESKTGKQLSPTTLLKQLIPKRSLWLRQRVRRLVNPVWLGTLRRTSPLSDHWGYDRGTPIDRYYIEQFLANYSRDIRGRVLEVKDSTYTDRYGSDVLQRDIIDINATNAQATVVADLTAADAIASATFDCFILTQTLQFIYHTRDALAHAHRILRPDGVLLVTVPCVSRIAPRYGLQTDFWRFTPASCAKLFGEIFGPEQVTVHAYGNALTAIAFLAGMAHEELTHQELEVHDDYFPLLIAIRAVKR